MTDLFTSAQAAIATRSMFSPVLAFVAGAATAIGPCAAPRMIAAIGLVGSESSARKRGMLLTALVGGLCAAYVAIGLASVSIGTLMRDSTIVYATFATVFAAIGIRTLSVQSSRCDRVADAPDGAGGSLGAAFLLGASLGLMVSPCCTPFLAMLVGLGVATGSALFGMAMFGAFALGHALPIIAAGFGAGTIRRSLCRFDNAVATVGGTLLVGLACYYAVLA